MCHVLLPQYLFTLNVSGNAVCACCVEIVCYIFISLHWIGSLMLGSYLDALANNLSLSLYIYTHTCIHKKLSRSFLIFSFFFFLGCVFSAPSLCWICKSSEFYHYYNFECCWQVKWSLVREMNGVQTCPLSSILYFMNHLRTSSLLIKRKAGKNNQPISWATAYFSYLTS